MLFNSETLSWSLKKLSNKKTFNDFDFSKVSGENIRPNFQINSELDMINSRINHMITVSV